MSEPYMHAKPSKDAEIFFEGLRYLAGSALRCSLTLHHANPPSSIRNLLFFNSIGNTWHTVPLHNPRMIFRHNCDYF